MLAPSPPQGPGPEQFERFRDALRQLAMPVDVQSEHIADFTGLIEATSIGDFTALTTSNRTVSIRRARAHIRQSDPVLHFLFLSLGPSHVVALDRSQSVMSAGDMMVLHSSRALQVASPRAVTHQKGCMITCEPSALQLSETSLDQLVGQLIPGNDALGGLVSEHLRRLASIGPIDEADSLRLSSATTDLLSVMLARRLRTTSTPSPERRERVRLLRVQQFITSRLGDATLTPEGIAAAQHVSLRTLHRLFEANTETTVARWIRDRRLERCRADLLDPALARRSVFAIALANGFTDASHVTRAFKARYGMSPGAYRAHHAR